MSQCTKVKDPRRKHFIEMWKLVIGSSLELPAWRDVSSVITTELLISQFWEETSFMNVRQCVALRQKGPKGETQFAEVGPARGFGQVEDGKYAFGLLKAAKDTDPNYRDVPDKIDVILGQDPTSLRLSVKTAMLAFRYVLEKILRGAGANARDKQEKILRILGGVSQLSGKDRERQLARIKGILDGAEALRAPMRDVKTRDGYFIPQRKFLEKALKLAAPHHSAYVPQVLEGIPNRDEEPAVVQLRADR